MSWSRPLIVGARSLGPISNFRAIGTPKSLQFTKLARPLCSRCQTRAFSLTLATRSQEDTVRTSSRATLQRQRSISGKTALRKTKLAVERSKAPRNASPSGNRLKEKIVAAYCGARQYNLRTVRKELERHGIEIDPFKTNLHSMVVHIRLGAEESPPASSTEIQEPGDVFIFPSGTVVAWDVAAPRVHRFIKTVLKPAAQDLHQIEDEDFEYVEDSSRDRSSIHLGTIVLGTDPITLGASDSAGKMPSPSGADQTNMVLVKAAFSFGIARSTKIAVLENSLDSYLHDTRVIPSMLMRGNLGSFSRSFIYQKMGQLLDIRGQLNLASDITDHLPDFFWDMDEELGLEDYYKKMSSELDTQQRIESLNQKMDYAHEIASILREELSVIREQQSEKHSSRLEWIIILLITVEVGFGSWELFKQYRSGDVLDVRVVGYEGTN